MEREYRKLDAENHLEEYEKYLKDEEVNKLEGKNRDRFLNDLVDLFEKYKDCNIAEEKYYSCEPDYILGADCFVEVDFQTVREEE